MEKLNDDHSNDDDSVLIIIIRIIIKLDCDPDTDYGVLKSLIIVLKWMIIFIVSIVMMMMMMSMMDKVYDFQEKGRTPY